MRHEAAGLDALRATSRTVLHAIVEHGPVADILREFKFDAVLGPECGQSEVFDAAGVSDLVRGALAGVNATCILYGMTGAGKTHTMIGSQENPGIVPRAVSALFARLADASTPLAVGIRASFLECYNEAVYDLLNPTGAPLRLRAGGSGGETARANGFFAEGQLLVDVRTVEELLSVVAEGSRRRAVASHALNADSSRSHALLTLHIETCSGGSGGGASTGGNVLTDACGGLPLTRRSKLVFDDLAGSERLGVSLSEGSTAVETRSINRSLFVLGKVISSLSDNSSSAACDIGAGRRGAVTQPPFRDSKLTKLLADGIGGSALTLLIACVSPTSAALDESLHTLNYAARAACIDSAPVVRMSAKDAALTVLQQEVTMLRVEAALLRRLFCLPPLGSDPLAPDAAAVLEARFAFLLAAEAERDATRAAAADAAESLLHISMDDASRRVATFAGTVPPYPRRSKAGAGGHSARSSSCVRRREGGDTMRHSGAILENEGAGAVETGENEAPRRRRGSSTNGATPVPPLMERARRRGSIHTGGAGWAAQRSIARSAAESVLDAQQSELLVVGVERGRMAESLEKARARVPALVAALDEQRRLVATLRSEVAAARVAQHTAEQRSMAAAPVTAVTASSPWTVLGSRSVLDDADCGKYGYDVSRSTIIHDASDHSAHGSYGLPGVHEYTA